MFRRQPIAALLVIFLVAACSAPAASPSRGVSASPTSSLPSPTTSPSAPAPTPSPTPTLVPVTPSPTIAPTKTPSPLPTPADTMVVRAYFLLRDPFSGGEVVNEPTLIPVLRTVPKSQATAMAAMRALLAGPSAKERAAMPQIVTLIPAGSKLLGIEISGGLATVDLSAKFASLSPDDAWDGGTFSLRGRLAQVVYTMTQFPSVDRVNFKLEGKPVKVFTIRGNRPEQARHPGDVPRSLPAADLRRATGVGRLHAEPGPGHRTRQRLRGAVPDRPARSQRQGPRRPSGDGHDAATATWGQFDVTLSYDVSRAQWGTLRVWDISEHSGKPVAVREYPVYLRPAP